MTPDPLPVALPELPTVAYTWKNLSKGPAGTIIDEIGFRAPGYIPTSQLDCLVRKSDAEAALRAQAEEVQRLRADRDYWRNQLCKPGRLPGRAIQCFGCEGVPAGDNDPCYVCGQTSAQLRAHLAASKQEKP